MAALVLNGITVQVVAGQFRRLPDEVGGAPDRRTVNGALRGDADWRKLGWQLSAFAENDPAAVALRTAVEGPSPIPASGALLGGAFTVRVEVGDDEYVRVRLVWYRVLVLTIREV